MTSQHFTQKLHDLIAEIPDSIGDEESSEVVNAVHMLLFELSIEGELEDAFDKWVEDSLARWCEIRGEHAWVHDHCGFWGHQYCIRCRERKYPEIPGRCAECGDLMKMTEEEYSTANPTAASPPHKRIGSLNK